MKVLIATLILAVLLGAVFVAYWFLKAQSAPKAEPYFRFLCPHCKRKLHYRAHKAGRQGVCPRCKQRCTYPLIPNSEW